MSDWIGLGVFVLVIVGAVAGLAYLGRPREPMSQEEFERKVAESRGTMSAGVAGIMYALQKLMNPKAAEAVEVQKDLRAGFFDAEAGKGEGDDDDEEEEAGREGEEPGLKRKDRKLDVEEDAEDEDDKDDA